MTNEEKLKEIDNAYATVYDGALAMAEWKDNQLRQTLGEHLKHATGERAEAFMELYRELFENV